MRDFPPKLIDMVIDHLPEDPESPEEPGLDLPMSNYSTVSRQWVERTQKHHFHRLFFPGPPYVQRWHEVFNPNPSGVSRHVRHLTLMRIDSLEDEDFDDHIRAFIHVQQLNLYGCSLLSLCDVRSLAIMGSSLVGLEIRNTKTTSHFMATLLVGLPHLRYLNIYDLMVEKDSDPAGPPPRIPFFEGANSFILSMVDCSPRNLDWIPPSPRFRDLRIEASTIQYYPALVNRWLDSSSRTLERFIVMEDLTGTCPDLFNTIFCRPPLTVWFHFRCRFRLPASLELHVPDLSRTSSYTRPTWAIRRRCPSLAPFFPTFESRIAGAGIG